MILLSITIHENPQIIIDMIKNIAYTYNGNAALIVHVSKDTSDKFFSEAESQGINFDDDRIILNKWQISTRWGNVLPMQISNFLYASLISNKKFSHFQIISPANMIIGKNLDQYICKNDIVINRPVRSADGWFWRAQADEDQNFKRFRELNQLAEPLCARVDGAAIRSDIFSDFVRRVLTVYSIEMLQTLDPVYPMEETLLPTFLWALNKDTHKFSPTKSKTFEPHEKGLDLERLKDIIDNDIYYYLKRISPSPRDPIRRHIMAHRS